MTLAAAIDEKKRLRSILKSKEITELYNFTGYVVQLDELPEVRIDGETNFLIITYKKNNIEEKMPFTLDITSDDSLSIFCNMVRNYVNCHNFRIRDDALSKLLECE